MKLVPEFLLSAAKPEHFPVPSAPEIAFLGRSNVGKSSMINSLLRHKIAHVSQTPGRTRTINFIGLHPQKASSEKPAPTMQLIFVDLPGYGFAKVSKSISSEWPHLIEPYLEHRDSLALCVCLVDCNVPVKESDLTLVHWLRAHQRPLAIVATKADRLSGNKLHNQLRVLRGELGGEILPCSAKTGSGLPAVWAAILDAANSQPQQG